MTIAKHIASQHDHFEIGRSFPSPSCLVGVANETLPACAGARDAGAVPPGQHCSEHAGLPGVPLPAGSPLHGRGGGGGGLSGGGQRGPTPLTFSSLPALGGCPGTGPAGGGQEGSLQVSWTVPLHECSTRKELKKAVSHAQYLFPGYVFILFSFYK